jgi:hypothetical protein
MGNHKPYLSHDEISYNISEYLCTVAGVDSITDISLDEINSYMSGLEDFYNKESNDVYKNSCDDSDCFCRKQLDWPDNIRDGCEREAAYNREAKTAHNPFSSVRNIVGSAVMSTFKGT